MSMLKLSVPQLAMAAGIGKQKVYRIIWGSGEPSFKEAKAMAGVLNVSMERLYEFLYENDMQSRDLPNCNSPVNIHELDGLNVPIIFVRPTLKLGSVRQTA